MEEEKKKYYMRRALELAQKAMGHTSPNPMVGCVVVKNDCIIAEGYHEHYGGFHAERNALLSCEEDPEGAELFVTLEPCCHYGKTPPCTEIILEKGIGKVTIGAMDPNPAVAGKGASILKAHGIEVETGILEEECLKLNEVFFHYITTNRPFLVMKYAMTLDGKIAVSSGDSKWVTGETARNHVQLLRKRYSGILAGIGTVLADDPMLNVRIEDGVDPVRILLDSHLRIPLESKILKTADKIPTILACTEKASQEKREAIRKLGADVLILPGEDKVDLKALVTELGKKKIDSVLIEGGGQVHGAFLEEGLIDKACIYMAPKLAGQSKYTPISGGRITKMTEAFSLEFDRIEKMGEDLYVEAYPKKEKGDGIVYRNY